ncbi:hypothetical protein THASP1DRAFT_27370 [Thamnocephalis sphaerospora]|uniref:F-box domain-containing protein n=1 Tax=Thamnocephalis sphaerospora TaxID=78915 RepID=A0A4P9XZD4_9FUNG|nr:hypothetical protein THASP1DRAFT_27370 [Thamnocephalis sphaerospora]|eukprot:RKP10830.1 hypothetical protein THASP1DRAFT_27370 [Thamnocephalis sphaerospora]
MTSLYGTPSRPPFLPLLIELDGQPGISRLPASLLAQLLAMLPLADLLSCCLAHRHLYHVATAVLYARPPLDARYGSPLPRFCALLRALPALPVNVRQQVQILSLVHVEETLYASVPGTWLRTLASYCHNLVALHIGEQNTFLNQDAVRMLAPGSLSTLRRLTLTQVESIDGTTLGRLLAAAPGLQHLRIVGSSCADVTGLAAVGEYAASSLRTLALVECEAATDRALARLFMYAHSDSGAAFPALESLQLAHLPISDATLQVLSAALNGCPQLCRLSTRMCHRITTAGLLAVLLAGRSRIGAQKAMHLSDGAAPEFTHLDIRRLARVTPALLMHLPREAAQLRALHLDLRLLRAALAGSTTTGSANSNDPLGLASLLCFPHLEQLVVDAGDTPGSLYGEPAAPWWSLCRALPRLRTLVLIGRWQTPDDESAQTDGNWGWSVPLDEQPTVTADTVPDFSGAFDNKDDAFWSSTLPLLLDQDAPTYAASLTRQSRSSIVATKSTLAPQLVDSYFDDPLLTLSPSVVARFTRASAAINPNPTRVYLVASQTRRDEFSW